MFYFFDLCCEAAKFFRIDGVHSTIGPPIIGPSIIGPLTIGPMNVGPTNIEPPLVHEFYLLMEYGSRSESRITKDLLRDVYNYSKSLQTLVSPQLHSCTCRSLAYPSSSINGTSLSEAFSYPFDVLQLKLSIYFVLLHCLVRIRCHVLPVFDCMMHQLIAAGVRFFFSQIYLLFKVSYDVMYNLGI